MEATNQGDGTDSHVEGIPNVERGEQFTAYVNPLVQQPPTADTSFHSPMEVRTNSPVETEYVPNAHFWRISMSQSLSEFQLTRPSFDNPSSSEGEHRRIQDSLDRAHNFQERVEIIIPSPVSHKEPMSALLPHLSDPWPFRYPTITEALAPIDDIPPHGVTSHNPGQTSNPTILNPRSISSPPISFVA